MNHDLKTKLEHLHLDLLDASAALRSEIAAAHIRLDAHSAAARIKARLATDLAQADEDHRCSKTGEV